jgi:hypothetical protein
LLDQFNWHNHNKKNLIKHKICLARRTKEIRATHTEPSKELLSRKVTEIDMINKMASPTHSGALVLTEGTLGPFTCFTCTSLQVLCVVYILKVNAICVLSMSDTLSQAKIQIADFHYHFLILLSNIF